MKKKQVLALMLAATMVTAAPIQAFAANETPMDSSKVEISAETMDSRSYVEFTYDSLNYTGHCRVENGKVIMNSIVMKQGAKDTVNYVFPGVVKYNGQSYPVRGIVGIGQEILTSAKTFVFSEGIETIVLYPSMLNLNELTLPSTLKTINGPMNETLPNGDFCIYLNGRIKRVIIPENCKFGYSKKYNCIYDKTITTTDPDAAKVDKSSLNEAIRVAEEAISSGIYTDSSISLLKEIVNDAIKVANDNDAVQSVVDDMTKKVNQGIKDLVAKPNVNKTALEEVIKTAKKEMTSDKYTDESISILEVAVNEAVEVLYKENATQDIIDSATEKVNQAIKNLVEKVVIPMTPLEPSKPIEKPEPPVEPEKPEPPVTPEKPEVNKASLEATIKAADEKVVMTDKYTEESIANLKAVLDEAKALVSDSNASQDMVDEMVRKLNSAMDGMVEKPVEPEKPEIPLTPLEPALPVEPEKPEIPLTPLEPSTPVEKPEKPEVEVVDKADLKDAIEKAEKEAALTTKYTKESIAKLNEVVKEAKAVLDKEDATQKDVDAMVEKVNKAMKDLVLVKPEQKPDENKKPSTDDKKPANTDKKPADKTTAPKTGDPASAGMLASLFAGSGAAIVAALKKRK